MITTFKDFKELSESNSFEDWSNIMNDLKIKNQFNWIRNVVLNDKKYVRTKNTKGKLEKYLDDILNYTPENPTLDKKSITKIINDFSKVFGTYYSLNRDERKLDLEKIQKDRGMEYLFSAKEKSDDYKVCQTLKLGVNFYSLLDAQRNIDKFNDIEHLLNKNENDFVEKYFSNMDKWATLYNSIKSIEDNLKSTQLKKKEEEKIKEIKGKVHPLMRDAINEIKEEFRITIEKNQLEFFNNRMLRLADKYNFKISKSDIEEAREKKQDILYGVHQFFEKAGSFLIPRVDYKEMMKKEANEISIEKSDGWAYKMFHKLGGLLNGVDIKFTIKKTSDNYRSNQLYFDFEDGASFTIRNKIVFKYSSSDTPFTQFVTTFHNAYLPDGERIKSPDEYTVKKAFNDYYN
jgi:hypothetical protein